LVAGEAFAIDPDAAAKQLGEGTRPVLQAALVAMRELPSFDAAEVEAALRSALVEGLGLKPKHAFGPIRVAVTGSTVSPPLFESIELLGRDVTLAR
ncbi:MAG: glutamyl-tRNA synthetase, partial [Pseudonocardiales bacterium]|nr:glutamyl-tRNA synthetase [Pseudonocardiales bacterium]